VAHPGQGDAASLLQKLQVLGAHPGQVHEKDVVLRFLQEVYPGRPGGGLLPRELVGQLGDALL